VLTPSEPVGKIALVAGETGPLVVRIAEIENPDRQAISIQVRLEIIADQRVRAFDVGAATPFPPSLPGTFVLPLPPAATEAIASGGDAVWVALELMPVATQQPLDEPLSVTVQASFGIPERPMALPPG
jgi:multidrug efflux pump subunit AcrA (membrane-fusion protein)